MTDQAEHGAFLFFRVRDDGAIPASMDTAAAKTLCSGGLAPLTPDYPGDRAVAMSVAARINRWGARQKPAVALRPVSKSKKRVKWVDNEDSAVTWTDGEGVTGSGPTAAMFAEQYAEAVGKVTTADWSKKLSSYITGDLGAWIARSDGRVYWLRPDAVDTALNASELLASVGIDLFVVPAKPIHVEAITRAVVSAAAAMATKLIEEGVPARASAADVATRLERVERLREAVATAHTYLGGDALAAVLSDTEAYRKEVKKAVEVKTAEELNREAPQPAAATPAAAAAPPTPEPPAAQIPVATLPPPPPPPLAEPEPTPPVPRLEVGANGSVLVMPLESHDGQQMTFTAAGELARTFLADAKERDVLGKWTPVGTLGHVFVGEAGEKMVASVHPVSPEMTKALSDFGFKLILQ